MKNLTLRQAVGIAAGALMLVLAAPAGAQVTSARFSVPFSFRAGNEVLPAGDYYAWVSSTPGFVDLQCSRDSRIHRVILSSHMVERADPSQDPALLRFERQGDQFVLRAVWNRSKMEGFEVNRSKRAPEMATGSAPVAVSIASK